MEEHSTLTIYATTTGMHAGTIVTLASWLYH